MIIIPMDSWKIASRLTKLSPEEREFRIGLLKDRPVSRHSNLSIKDSVRGWLKDYDDDFLDTRTFLDKVAQSNG